MSASSAVPRDDDDTRNAHLRVLSRRPVFLSLTLTGLIAAFTIGTVVAGPLIGAAVAFSVLMLALVVILAIASGRAKEDFLRAYAQDRELTRRGRGRLSPATPLLRRGDDRYATERMDGVLPGGEPGTLAHYTYEETHRDSRGNRQSTHHRFTVAICEVPESAVQVAELYCQRRVGFRFLDGFEDAFRRKQRLVRRLDASRPSGRRTFASRFAGAP